MRGIKVRGLELMTGDWVRGSHLKTGTGSEYIVPQNLIANHLPQYAVDKDTVGQYTGLKDKNGREIYEGDIVQDIHDDLYKSVVEYRTEDVGSCGCCYGSFVGAGFIAKELNLLECEVIGNIHENPELLGDSK